MGEPTKNPQLLWVKSKERQKLKEWLHDTNHVFPDYVELENIVQENEIISDKERWNRANKVRFFKTLSAQKSNEKALITKAPGHSYISLAKIILTKRSYVRIMKPSILMMQEEYFEYYQKGNKKFAFFVKIRFSFIFLFILGLNFPLIKQLLDIKEKIAK